jgi:class 3 adenylate cyclase
VEKPPAVRYAKTADGAHIAFQVVGDGPALVYMPHWATHLEMLWEEPLISSFVRRLATFSKVIMFDKSGVGLSDPVPTPMLPTLEKWCDDALAVLDASSTDRATLVGCDAGAVLAQLFAALHPSRTSALVLYGTAARVRRAADYPAGLPDRLVELFLEMVEQGWGASPVGLDLSDPSMTRDEAYRDWQVRFQRQSASPGVIMAMMRMIVDVDLRGILPTIRVPTLVLHRTNDSWYPIAHGRYLAEHIPGARFVELEGSDHSIEFGDSDAAVRQIELFLTGTSHAPEVDRVLTTVLFTDLVSSTEEASHRGDQSWRSLLDRHDALVQRQLDRYRGRLIKTMGDGLLATFDGPARAVRCASAIRDAVRSLGLEIRAGLHTGEVVMSGDDVSGIAVNIAQRVCSAAQANEIIVSRTVVDLVAGSGIGFEDRGDHTLKGVPGSWQLFSVPA